jgi:AcrR family transcriptional regulator
MVTVRRIGAETSKTRVLVLDAAQEVMLEDGYAAATYRSIAKRAGVTAGLVQYYFPTLDDLFIALLRHRSDQSHERLLAELEARPDEPLRIIWEFSSNETTAALMTEFMALGNHRKAVQATFVEVSARTRKEQLKALKSRWSTYRGRAGGLSPEALVALLHGIPKVLQLEDAVGISTAHTELLRSVERRLAEVEPRRAATRASSRTVKKRSRS